MLGSLGRINIVVIGVVHVDLLERGFVGEEQAVVECVARVDMVSERDVGKFQRYDRGIRLLVGHRVNQSLAEQNGVPDRSGFNRGGKQHAAVHRVRECQIVRHGQVDDDLIQHRGLKTAGCQRSHKAGLHQAIEHVILSLGNPSARGLERAHVL